MPEIEFIIGPQPPPIALGPTEALNRFQRAFQNFVAALARPEHPLVVFLDDLQWADAATLSLLEPLLTSREIPCLFLMGAYRDNEVDATHPLARTFAALESAGVALTRITLGPLQLPDLTLLIRDTLHNELEAAAPLAQLVAQKTGGNPFFVTQFLRILKDDGYLNFDYERGRWIYRIEAIARAPLTDNVVDLLTRKIRRLPPPTQRALTLAGCIGNSFDADTLAIVSGQPIASITADLAPAIGEGLIRRETADHAAAASRDDAGKLDYSFLHDRVQQSAYALIPAEQRASVHLRIGRSLRERLAGEQADENVFAIVHHYNIGRALITDQAESVAVAKLNLSAGRKAKTSTAHAAALAFFLAGLERLGEPSWASDYALAFDLNIEAAESHYLCGEFDRAESALALLLARAATNLDRGRVHRLRSVRYENMSRYAEALASARAASNSSASVCRRPRPRRRRRSKPRSPRFETLMRHASIASLAALPVMSSPEIRMVMSILTDVWASTYILGDAALARLISATMVRLSLEHGNVEESAYGYVTHAITVGPVRQRVPGRPTSSAGWPWRSTIDSPIRGGARRSTSSSTRT